MDKKTHYNELLTYIERMLKTYAEYKKFPEDLVQFGVIEKEGLGKDEERTAYTQLINDIGILYHKAAN